MKKRVILFTTSLLFGGVILMSEMEGPALFGNNKTGAKNSVTNCGGGGCHGGNSANTSVVIALDSAFSPATGYVPGEVYNIVISAANTVSGATHFGFQLTSVSGTGATQVNAGTFTGSLPANVAIHSLSGLNIVEHTAAIAGIAGGGTTTFGEEIEWTAPPAGTGTVKIYCTVNAVNNNGEADNGDLSGNTSISLTERVPVANSVAAIASNVGIKTYPNPVTNSLQLQLDNAATGNYTVNVYDMSGKKVTTENITVNSSSYTATINTHSWAAGIYALQVIKDGAQRLIPVVKQ